ncbi:hypothetical protein QOK74_07870 [Staphylococcus saprophyticus]|uniref:hypothetical protein n=1 Tax=Staphylococcus saprophyticus TaxID=29385 RepID=UPI0024C24B48|nr:hypothetical protein [Staphylococcus saprophyticus]MDK1672786.1 hypothetical protein [Staphylococcus saprophyticus]
MEKKELKQFIDGIFVAYEFDKELFGLDEASIRVFDKNIFIAIKQLQKLPFSIHNIWFKWTYKSRLQSLYINLHPELTNKIYK